MNYAPHQWCSDTQILSVHMYNGHGPKCSSYMKHCRLPSNMAASPHPLYFSNEPVQNKNIIHWDTTSQDRSMPLPCTDSHRYPAEILKSTMNPARDETQKGREDLRPKLTLLLNTAWLRTKKAVRWVQFAHPIVERWGDLHQFS